MYKKIILSILLANGASVCAESNDYSVASRSVMLSTYEDEQGNWNYPLESDLTLDVAGYEPISTVDIECLNSYGKFEVALFNPECGEDGERLWSQTKLMFGLGVGVAGVIWLLPEDVSGWDKSDPTPLGESWRNNVREGPVWDQDDHLINYVGHPYFGGVYYQSARNSGYNEWNSFFYSFLMSTFYWEYGLEAFAEVPSIQDLIVTPVGGYFYGEWAYKTERKILANGGHAFGSRGWGNVSLFLLNPVDRIGSGINSVVGKKWIKTGAVGITRMAPDVDRDLAKNMGEYWGLQLQLQF